MNHPHSEETIEGIATNEDALIDELLERASRQRLRAGRPFVTVSYAQSLDGCIALQEGGQLTLSCRQSLILTHRLRAVHDAILVGIGTVLSDDPALTTRLAKGKDPLPVVVDTNLRIPIDARLISSHSSPVIVAINERADYERQKALQAAIRIVRLPINSKGWVDLSVLLQRLGEMGIETVMVEGGARIITSFLSERLVDQVIVTVAPVLIGGLRAVHRIDQSDSGCLPRLHNPRYQKIAEDLVLWGEPVW